MAFHLGVQKNPKIIALAVILVVLGIAAFLLAEQCGFFQCGTPAENGLLF